MMGQLVTLPRGMPKPRAKTSLRPAKRSEGAVRGKISVGRQDYLLAGLSQNKEGTVPEPATPLGQQCGPQNPTPRQNHQTELQRAHSINPTSFRLHIYIYVNQCHPPTPRNKDKNEAYREWSTIMFTTTYQSFKMLPSMCPAKAKEKEKYPLLLGKASYPETGPENKLRMSESGSRSVLAGTPQASVL